MDQTTHYSIFSRENNKVYDSSPALKLFPSHLFYSFVYFDWLEKARKKICMEINCSIWVTQIHSLPLSLSLQ